MSGVGQFFLALACIVLFGLLGFCIGYKFHKDPTYEENIKAMEEYLEISEKIAIKQAEKAAADTLKTALEDKMSRKSTNKKDNDATMKEFKNMMQKAENDPKSADECRKRMLELDDIYQQRRGFVILWAIIFAIIGFFIFWFGIRALLDSVFYKPLTQEGAENILKEYINEDLTFDELTSAKLGIPTFELQDQYSLYFSPITNTDPNFSASKLTVLEATVAGVSEPFVYMPALYHDLKLVSAYNYASNPLYQSITLISSVYNNDVDFTATSFFINYQTEIEEKDLPNSTYDWGKEIDGLIYYMENNAQKYITQVLFNYLQSGDANAYVPVQYKIGGIDRKQPLNNQEKDVIQAYATAAYNEQQTGLDAQIAALTKKAFFGKYSC